jgi:hypothetical protein
LGACHNVGQISSLPRSSEKHSNTGSIHSTKLSLTKKEQQTDSEDVIAQYQLLFVRTAKGTNATTGADTEVLVFLKLLGQFTQFLKTHCASKSVSILQAHIQAHAEITRMSDKLLDGFANLDPMMFDAVFATTLCKFGWTTEIPNINPHIVKYALGLYHFAQV